ncbi:MAG: hypothetical protein K5912_03980 [Alphaproteobacteria bacterium]|nr:hypothetical protein [Alphaproteobacteria bacterium]
MKKCPWFSVCGGCKYDFSAPDYKEQKKKEINRWNLSKEPFWGQIGLRRRADFCFADGVLGFFQRGTKNIVKIDNCPLLVPEINSVLPKLAELPWSGAGSALVTLCDNGLAMSITSSVPYFSKEFKDAVSKIGLIQVTWNGTVVFQAKQPKITFENKTVDFLPGAFLQPTRESENAIRRFVMEHAAGRKHIVDLFCGLGNFTFALGADGFDIVGTGVKRDLFKKPLGAKALNNYDCVVMDPPRAGAFEQSREIAKSGVPLIIYVSCNPSTFKRDADVLVKAGYKITELQAFDQFVGSEHWELVAVFEK